STPNSKLNEEQVKEIKRLLAEGRMSKTAIGRLFGVTDVAICYIANGKTWSHVEI
ncbi:unnamed protein product, partial [marine sediment metagenome]